MKKSEECIAIKYNEVVQIIKDTEDKHEMSKMSTKVAEVINSQEDQVVKMTEIMDK